MGQGEFLALIMALYMAYSPIKKLGNIHGQLKALEAPLNRLESVLAEPDTVPEPADPVTMAKPARGEITFKDVHFDYTEAKPVLNGVSVKINAGESVGLVGSSGAGKSSFVNLIPRFYDISSGSIEIDGVDIRKLRLKDLRDQIAYVPQMPMLYSMPRSRITSAWVKPMPRMQKSRPPPSRPMPSSLSSPCQTASIRF